jgi:alpha-tubulin suppressor-like RCC1 family protein
MPDIGRLITGLGVAAVCACAQDDATRPGMGVATRLAFTGQPTSTVAGIPLSPAVQVSALDAAGNAASFSGPIVLTLANATLGGTTTVAAANGVATFSDLTITRAGTGYNLVAAAGSLTSATSSAFAVAGGPPRILSFTVQPNSAIVAQSVAPAVEVTVQDAFANPASDAGLTVALALGTNPTAATLGGTTSIPTVGGVARFADLRLDKVGTGYTLTAGAASLAATSSVFSIAPPPHGPAISVGATQSCGLTTAGRAWCWGANFSGQLGRGGIGGRSDVPVAVLDSRPFAGLATGGGHTCALTPGGSAFCWGANVEGQLGDGTEIGRGSPVAVAGGHSFWALTAGSEHTCGLAFSGAAYCWGYNSWGQAGVSSSRWLTLPMPVSGGLSLVAISAGESHTCGIASDGTWCWGYNWYGQLGGGSASEFSSTPVRIPGNEVFAEISAGGFHTCGRTTAGQVYCWGANAGGQLGDGTTGASSGPTRVAGNLTFASVSAGGMFTCGLTNAGVAYCWGSGPLGDGNNSASPMPVAVAGNLTFSAIDAGASHVCATTSSGAAFCWGNNSEGAVGTGSQYGSTVPAPVFGGPFSTLTAGNWHSCGLTSGGAAYCWGYNLDGELGNGVITVSSSARPLPVDGGLTFLSLSAGGKHTCGVASGGTAYCWGDNGELQLGTGMVNESYMPVSVYGITFTMVSSGREHTCGVTTASEAYCWGYNVDGQLGNGFFGRTGSGPAIVEGDLTFSSVTAGGDHTCGLTPTGAAYCWGSDNGGQLGTGLYTRSATPVAVTGGHVFAMLMATASYTCGLTMTGAIYCWGDNASGQLGIGSLTSVAVPTMVGGGVQRSVIAVGTQHACGVTTAGAAQCWGTNIYGQLGNNSTTNSLSPVTVFGGLSFSTITAGAQHTCAVSTNGSSYCWGENGHGALGTSNDVPMPVVGGVVFRTS